VAAMDLEVDAEAKHDKLVTPVSIPLPLCLGVKGDKDGASSGETWHIGHCQGSMWLLGARRGICCTHPGTTVAQANACSHNNPPPHMCGTPCSLDGAANDGEDAKERMTMWGIDEYALYVKKWWERSRVCIFVHTKYMFVRFQKKNTCLFICLYLGQKTCCEHTK
jgi:hypothetical protein